MHLLKKGVPFIWDDPFQFSFDGLKHTLTSTPLLKPPNYNKDFMLYLATFKPPLAWFLSKLMMNKMNMVFTISVRALLVLNFVMLMLRSWHWDVFFVQRFRHYILLQTTTVISDANPMQYILSLHILRGIYSKWIVILQEFNLEFSTAKSKKSLVFAELMTTFLESMMNLWYKICYLMNICFSLTHPIHGTEMC
jgi:hypothetical protein